MSTNEWNGPWKCSQCGKAFKCQDLRGDCHTKEQVVKLGCRCYEHTIFAFIELKMAQCRVEPFIHESKPRKGKLISGTELIQI